MRILFLLAILSLPVAIHAQTKQTLVPFLKKNGKYIYVDSATMKPVITKEFGSAGFFDEDGLASVNDVAFELFVNTGTPTYIIDKSGKIARSGQYELSSQYHNNGLAEIKADKKIGLVNKQGVVVVPPIWDEIIRYSETLIAVKSNDKWGYCDLSGRLKIPMKYEEVKDFDGHLAFVKLNDKWGAIDTTGKVVIPFHYKRASWFTDGLAYVSKDGDNWTTINQQGKEIVPGFVYSEIRSFSNGLAEVRLNNKWGLVNTGGKLTVPFQFDSISYFSWKAPHIAPAVQKGKWGCINQQGKTVVPFIYDEIKPFYDDKFTVVKSGEKYGAISLDGKLVIPLVYDDLEVLNNKYLMASLGDKWALADISNKLLTGFNFYPIGYNGSDFSENAGLLRVSATPSYGLFDNGSHYYIDLSGREYREK